jgi:hypothetical protein
MISEIPENSREFRFLLPESRKLISVGNLETVILPFEAMQSSYWHSR